MMNLIKNVCAGLKEFHEHYVAIHSEHHMC